MFCGVLQDHIRADRRKLFVYGLIAGGRCRDRTYDLSRVKGTLIAQKSAQAAIKLRRFSNKSDRL
jgi:hypothetical protein